MNKQALYYILNILKNTSFIRTIYFNFHYLPLNKACRLPIFIGRSVRFRKLNGTIEIKGDLKPAMISFATKLIFKDDVKKRTYINNQGKLVFKGDAIFHTGVNLTTEKDATIIFGNKFRVGDNSTIYSRKKIVFGECVMISWNFQALDTDFHYLQNTRTNEVYNNTKSIILGNKIWIGNSVTLAKGVEINDNCIIAANSFVNKKFLEENIVIGGMPAKKIVAERACVWDYDKELSYNQEFKQNE